MSMTMTGKTKCTPPPLVCFGGNGVSRKMAFEIYWPLSMQTKDFLYSYLLNKRRFWNGENIQQNKNSEKPTEIISTSGSLSIDEQCWPPWRGQPRHSDEFSPFFVRSHGSFMSVFLIYWQLSQGQMANFSAFIASKSFDLWNHHIPQIKWHNLGHILMFKNNTV